MQHVKKVISNNKDGRCDVKLYLFLRVNHRIIFNDDTIKKISDADPEDCLSLPKIKTSFRTSGFLTCYFIPLSLYIFLNF
jgi:hypothetical protein